MAEIIELFSVLPYGKYAFYIWTSYAICAIALLILWQRSRTLHSKTIRLLTQKYMREEQYEK